MIFTQFIFWFMWKYWHVKTTCYYLLTADFFQLFCQKTSTDIRYYEKMRIHHFEKSEEVFHLQFDIMCDLILSAVWYHLQFDIVDEFDIICSLILLTDLIWSAVWYHSQLNIVDRFDIITDCFLLASITQWD